MRHPSISTILVRTEIDKASKLVMAKVTRADPEVARSNLDLQNSAAGEALRVAGGVSAKGKALAQGRYRVAQVTVTIFSKQYFQP